MPLIKRTDTELIELPVPGEWVRLQRTMSKGDRVAILQAAAKGSKLTAGGEMVLDGAEAIGAISFARLDRVLVEWSFPEPVTPLNIRALDEASVDAIDEQIAARGLYPELRAPEDSKPSLPSTETPSSDAAASPTI